MKKHKLRFNTKKETYKTASVLSIHMWGKDFFKRNWMKILLVLIAAIFLAIEMKTVFMFLVISIISFLFNYYQNKFKLPFDLSPMVFFSAIIAIKIGIFPMIAFIIISGIVPTFITGGEITLNTFIFMAHIILLNVIIASLPISLAILAIVYPVALGMTMVSVTILSNEEILRRISVPVIAVFVNMVYFMNLSAFFRIV